ncbi:unnamed protein product [Phytomonas sp. Hart1]|nr:unnamed protein product [Phytomonas sp. Hart1]|eukprot:CCW70167.1 unnamed protein product [Phytomonas sp. isolate Hart1]
MERMYIPSDQAFREKLQSSTCQNIEPVSLIERHVNNELERVRNPRKLYKFQRPREFSFKGRAVTADASIKRIRYNGKINNYAQSEETDYNDHDVKLLRMIQRACKKPRIDEKPDKTVAPNDDVLKSKLLTDKDVVAFFSIHGDKSPLKYVILNPTPRSLEFRPYDLVVSHKGEEKAEHYIMSATGVVHVRPNCPSEVISLGDWVEEKSLFNVLRRIPFFKNFLLYKAFFRLYKKLREKKFAAKRKMLSNDFLLIKSTFLATQQDLCKTSNELSNVALIAYEPQGKHDFFIEDFRMQQLRQRQKASGEINSTLERVEEKVTNLINCLQSRADVPDMTTRAAIEQYLMSSELSSIELKRVKLLKSMIERKGEQIRKLLELKRSLVEYSQIDVFVRLVDLMMSENLFKNALSTSQVFFNILRNQSGESIRKVGFQVLLHPKPTKMDFDPSASVVKNLFIEIVNGYSDLVSSVTRLSEQRYYKAFFKKNPRLWNIGLKIKKDARFNFLQQSMIQIIKNDYELAYVRMGTYSAVLPDIHFLQNEWTQIEKEQLEENKEAHHSSTSLAKLYRRLQKAQDSLRVLMSTFVGNTLWINATKLKSEIEPRVQILKEEVDATLRSVTCDVIQKLHTNFKHKIQLLNERPQTLSDFAEYVDEYKKVKAEMPAIEDSISQAEALCEIMDRHQVEFAEDEDKQLKERTLGNTSMVASLHAVFDDVCLKAEEFIEEHLPFHVETLVSQVANLEEECSGIRHILSGKEFVTLVDIIETVIEYLDNIMSNLDDISKTRACLTRYANLFDHSSLNWTVLDETISLAMSRKETWTLLDEFSKKVEYWFDCPLDELNTEEMEEEVISMLKRSDIANRTIKAKDYEDEIIPHLLHKLHAIRQNITTIHDCGNKHMSSENWNVVLKEVVGPMCTYHRELNLNFLQEHGIFNNKEILSEQSGLATAQWKINNDLDGIREIWDAILINLKPYKNREGVFILSDLDDIIQQLDDHQIELQTIMASRFAASIRGKVETWIDNLRLVSNVLDEWITLQKNWMYLEFIFSSDDIKEQLPEESKSFDKVDRFYCTLTTKASVIRNVYQICTEDGLLDDIKRSNEYIDHIQKRLEDYLETKRIAFPRFYFLSNDELLSILSDTRNPKSVQPHLPKCFDSIALLIFEDEEYNSILGMISGEGENVMFPRPIHPVGGVEQWLNEVEGIMKISLHQHTQKTIEAYSRSPREEWFFNHPAQCVQAVDMIVWTGEVEEAITADSLDTYHANYQNQILNMVQIVKKPLNKLNRALLCTLIVLDVHNRDIVQTLHQRHVVEVGDFNWHQQLRYYWEKDAGMPNGMNIGIAHCNAHLWYGYEYLGNQPRLVITPLTDRAFLTCTNALSMNLGAAPQGPAGTGKTESVKDLGKALARQVVVFNCSDGINYKTMSRMFAGLAQAGAWACFDEFNRIELEVLSVIAQQMLEITTALNQKLERMNFEGHPIQLNKNFGVFITMNPDYAGRNTLPDNLKALFRPICMMIPDYALIAEIMFYSEGFSDARTLAKKMVQLYKLSSEQLSKQDHYDFGMRAVKSILVMAGALKRNDANEKEDMLLIRAIRDANVPKFLRDDNILFMALVRDLFPSVKIEECHNELLLDYIQRIMEKEGLQIVDGMITKTIQLYNTLEVRHGLMLVGQSLSGKSAVIRTLQHALINLKMDGHDEDGKHPLYNRVQVHFLNPKSITMGELYGHVNEITREWTDGVLSGVARYITRTALDKPDRHWVIFDGPVDALWIENMNTVLDDNKLLCLFNGERIKLPNTATFMFEVQDLKVASPATVSRCGMVYMEPYYLDGDRGWIPIAKSLIRRKAEANEFIQAERLMTLLEQFVPDTLDFLRKNCNEWIPSIDAQLVINCIELLYAFVKARDQSNLWPAGITRPIEEAANEAENNEDPNEQSYLYSSSSNMSNPRQRKSVCPPPDIFRCPPITHATVAAPNEERLFDMYFIMAFIWSFGGNIRDDARGTFSQFSKEKVSQLMPGLLPSDPDKDENLSLYNLVVHLPSKRFTTWDYLVPDFNYQPDVPYFDHVVPTADSVALKTILHVLMNSSRSVLINGVTGTGKSLTALNFLQDTLRTDEPDTVWEYFGTVLSSQTRSKDLEMRLLSKLTKLRSNVLGPTMGKTAVFFVDDLNMPALEKFGASPPLELLRQVLTQGGFFDTHKSPASFKHVRDLVFLAACGVPGGGRNSMTTRLTSRFHLLCQPAMSTSTTTRIFGSILYGFLYQWKSSEVLGLSMPLVEATRQCYERITQEKLPTTTRSHYTFNLRDFGRVIQGMMQASPKSAPGKEELCRLFVHEVSRTFHDRLADEGDRQWWWRTLKEVLEKTLDFPWSEDFPNLLFGDYMQRNRVHYEEIRDHDAIPDMLSEYLNSYNMTYNKEVDLVFFQDAIKHISRICRVLRQPRGNVLLAGMGGTGRHSLCCLAASICDLPVHELVLTRSFGLAEFHETLKKILMECGGRDKSVVFFMSDAQVVREEMLEDINNLLNTGEVPDLMLAEDVDAVVELVRPLAIAAGRKETRNAIFAHFVSTCRDQMRIVLAMSPVGDKFRSRLRLFPSLVNCCFIDWFDQWPSDALDAVATRVLDPVPIDEPVKRSLVQLCVKIHLDVQKSSVDFFDELQRRNYTTPASYLELLSCYCEFLQERERSVREQIERYQGGLNTLRETERIVDEMKGQLVEMQPRLIEAAHDTQTLMEKIEKEKEEAEVVRKECAKDEHEASEIQAEADGIRAECQTELNKALPILKSAEDALAELRPDDIREVRSFQKPAARVVLVLEAVLTLLGEKDVSWERSKLVMSRMDFIKDLQNYQRDELTEKMIRSIQKYVNNPDFQPDEVAKSSKACRSLSLWVLAINNYYEVVKVVAPKRKRLAEAEAKVAVANQSLQHARGRLNAIEEALSQLQSDMKENIRKKEKLGEDIELITVRLGRAEQLMSGLSSEQLRWSDSIVALDEERSGHVGNIALAASFVAYLGPFTHAYRARMLKMWFDSCRSLHVPVGKSEVFDVCKIVDPVRIRAWGQQGLPPDSFSVENGVVVSKSRRWCLCIDPQGQAASWIRELEKKNDLRVVKLTDSNYLRILEAAIQRGLPVLIENVEESLDATLDPILLRQTYHSQGRLLIKIGDSEISYDPNFRLYITTKLPNPHYLPELQIKVTILNFTVTQEGLENQLLADVVRFEYAELEQRADATIVEIAEVKTKLKEVEDNILNLLSSSTGNILDNESLVAALQDAKRTSESVSASLVVSEQTQREIQSARDRYRPVATRGSIIYSVLSELAGLDRMYQNSLVFFKQLFTKTLNQTPRRENVEERVGLLLPAITLETYGTICRGLFEKDKLIFAFLLYSHIARHAGEMSEEEWLFALKGSEGQSYLSDMNYRTPDWLPALQWNEVIALSTRIKKFAGLLDEIRKHPDEWKAWFADDKAYERFPAFMNELDQEEDEPLQEATPHKTEEEDEAPNEDKPHEEEENDALKESNPHEEEDKISEKANRTEFSEPQKRFSTWEKLLLLKAFREDLFNHGLTLLVEEKLGKEFLESSGFDLEGCFRDSSPSAPIIFILIPGTDPTSLFTEFAERKGFRSRYHMLSLGQGQGEKAEKMIRDGWLDGVWVYLQNCHLYASWIPTLERLMDGMLESGVHPNFRLWLTTMPTPAFPVLLLQSGVKVVKEPPKGLRANIRDTFTQILTPDGWENGGMRNPTAWRRLVFSLAYFHAVIQERRRFGPLGWNIPYEWNQSDLAASLHTLSVYIPHEGPPLPWEALYFMIGVINYGGRVTDFLDTRCLGTMITSFMNPDAVRPARYDLTQDGIYHIPAETASFRAIQTYLAELPNFESPEIFGLHGNAETTLNRRAVRAGLAAVLAVQPRRKAPAPSGEGRAEKEKDGAANRPNAEDEAPTDKDGEGRMLAMVMALKGRLPPPIDPAAAHPSSYQKAADGTISSLGTVLRQEVDILNGLLAMLAGSLTELFRGIKGEVGMSCELDEMLDAILIGAVPRMWLERGYLSRKPLASWFVDTLDRVAFFRAWNDHGLPKSFWISGFYFPQGLLTAFLQTYSRPRKIPIDDVVFQTKMTIDAGPDDIEEDSGDGFFIHGLFLEGARYDIGMGCLAESRKGELFTSLPVIHLIPVRQSLLSEDDENKKKKTMYSCPVYKTAARVGMLSTTGLSTNYVISLDIRAGNKNDENFRATPEHWIKRGVAILCMLDD